MHKLALSLVLPLSSLPFCYYQLQYHPFCGLQYKLVSIIDFNTLPTHAVVFTCNGSHIQQQAQTFTLQISPHNGELQLAPAPTHPIKINSFTQWMEALNIYVSSLLLAKPSKVLEMLGCQCIIASLNLRFPITTWMTYDLKLPTLAASYPSLCWDIRHLDTWVECISMP